MVVGAHRQSGLIRLRQHDIAVPLGRAKITQRERNRLGTFGGAQITQRFKGSGTDAVGIFLTVSRGVAHIAATTYCDDSLAHGSQIGQLGIPSQRISSPDIDEDIVRQHQLHQPPEPAATFCRRSDRLDNWIRGLRDATSPVHNILV